jgi:adenine/guanine phosphoribosyltransferase-like PRPP-binding protein
VPVRYPELKKERPAVTLAPHQFWQTLDPPQTDSMTPATGYSGFYPARLPDGRLLRLPIRVLPGDGESAVASLIINQASFVVEDALADAMANLVRPFDPEVVVGVPTLGLPLANGVARRLGHTRMVALGTSRKFWYRDELSEPMSSITSPAHAKRIFMDPRMLPLLEGKRVAVVDDVVSSGTSMAAVTRLLRNAGIKPVSIVLAMLQGTKWRETLAEVDVGIPGKVLGAITSPRLRKASSGNWLPE